MIREAELFVMGEQVATQTLCRLDREHRNVKVPPPFGLPDAPVVSVGSVLRQHARDDAAVPDLLAGNTVPDEPAPFTVDPALLTRLAEAAIAAAEKATDAAAVVHTPEGDLATGEYLLRRAAVRAFTAHEVAVFIGSVCPLTEAFARQMWEATQARAEDWRDIGVFGPPLLPVPDDVSWRDRFLMAAGRDPHPLWDRH